MDCNWDAEFYKEQEMKARHECDKLATEIESLRQQLATEKTEFEQCSDMLTNAERHIETLEEQLVAAESKIDTLTKEVEVQSYWGPRWEAEYAARMAALAACEVKQAALQEIIDLMSESYGLTGFHLNGDIAPWSELEEGGRFERLASLNNAVTIQPDASALKAPVTLVVRLGRRLPLCGQCFRFGLVVDGVTLRQQTQRIDRQIPFDRRGPIKAPTQGADAMADPASAHALQFQQRLV